MKKANSRPKKPSTRVRRAPAAGDADLRPEYDFRGGVRGKYAARFAADRPVRVVVLAPDVADAFASARAVNAALRRLVRERDGLRAAGRKSRRTA